MGPQRFRCGNWLGNNAMRLRGTRLQWGHNVSVVEILWYQTEFYWQAPSFNGATTFPLWKYRFRHGLTNNFLMLQWGHNVSVVEIILLVGLSYWHIPLQWGHNVSVVEILRSILHAVCCKRLQWGHNVSVVEINSRGTVNVIMSTSFNGATTFPLWKFTYPLSFAKPVSSFNGATTFPLWKLLGLYLQ